jgi:hypothetical protein
MITLSCWYKQVPLQEIKKSWIDLILLLGFERVGKREDSGSWDYVRLNDTFVFFGMSKRMEKHVAVDIFSRQDEIVPHLEIALKRLYRQRHTLLPSESFLVKGVEESSGPLLTLWKDSPEKLFEQVALNFTPQIRVANVSLCGDIQNLERISANYAVSIKVVWDNLWLDFGWSQFSGSWDLALTA